MYNIGDHFLPGWKDVHEPRKKKKPARRANFEGRLSDLSEGGFYIDTINPVPEGSIIAFRFVLVEKDGDSIIEGEGRVAWQRPFQGMGIAFTRLSDDVRDRLKAHFSRA